MRGVRGSLEQLDDLQVRVFEHADKGQVPVVVVVVQSISHNEDIRDAEAEEVGSHFDRAAALFHQEHGSANAARLAALEGAHQSFERLSGVEDVVDDEHVAIANVRDEIHADVQVAGDGRLAAIARSMHDADAVRDRDFADEIGHEEHAPREHADDGQGPVAIVVREHSPEFLDALPNLCCFEESLHRFVLFLTGRGLSFRGRR